MFDENDFKGQALDGKLAVADALLKLMHANGPDAKEMLSTVLGGRDKDMAEIESAFQSFKDLKKNGWTDVSKDRGDDDTSHAILQATGTTYGADFNKIGRGMDSKHDTKLVKFEQDQPYGVAGKKHKASVYI